MLRKVSGATSDGDHEECYADSPLRVSSNRAFQQAYPDEAKDAAMHLINTARMAEWIASDLVPAINELGKNHQVKRAEELQPPVICMQQKYQPILQEPSSTKHPAGDTLWFSKNFHRIEAAVRPDPHERSVNENEDTMPIQQRLQEK